MSYVLNLRKVGLVFPVALFVGACTHGNAVNSGRVADGSYRMVDALQLPEIGTFDLLTIDPVSRRLFITRQDRVQVVDIDRLTVVGEILHLPLPHSVAIARQLNRGFVTTSGDTSIVIFDLTTLRPVATVHATGALPDEVIYDPTTRRVFSMNTTSQNATAIDAVSGQVLGTIQLGGAGESALADGNGHIYVNLKDRDSLVDFDTRTMRIDRRIALGNSCDNPHALSYDRTKERFLIGCSGVLAVVEIRSGNVVSTMETHGIADQNAFDPGTGLLFQPGGFPDSLLVLRDTGGGQYVPVVKLQSLHRAKMAAVDPRTHRVFVVGYVDSTYHPSARDDDWRHPTPVVAKALVFGR